MKIYKIKKVIAILLLFVLTGCSDVQHSDIVSPGGGAYWTIENTPLEMYVDLSDENWEQNEYNSVNFFKHNGIFYYKEQLRLYQINGLQTKLVWKGIDQRECKLSNGTIYGCSNLKLDGVNTESIYARNSEYRGELPDTLAYRIFVPNWYNGNYYYSKYNEDNTLIEIIELDINTKQERTIKVVEAFNLIKLIHFDEYILVCSIDSRELSNFEEKFEVSFKIEKISRTDLTTNSEILNLNFKSFSSNHISNFTLELLDEHIKVFDDKVYVFSLDKANDSMEVNVIDISNENIINEKYTFDYEGDAVTARYDLEINVYNENHYYIIEDSQVSRISRQTGEVELVCKVKE